jgi:hypothetical protein
MRIFFMPLELGTMLVPCQKGKELPWVAPLEGSRFAYLLATALWVRKNNVANPGQHSASEVLDSLTPMPAPTPEKNKYSKPFSSDEVLLYLKAQKIHSWCPSKSAIWMEKRCPRRSYGTINQGMGRRRKKAYAISVKGAPVMKRCWSSATIIIVYSAVQHYMALNDAQIQQLQSHEPIPSRKSARFGSALIKPSDEFVQHIKALLNGTFSHTLMLKIIISLNGFVKTAINYLERRNKASKETIATYEKQHKALMEGQEQMSPEDQQQQLKKQLENGGHVVKRCVKNNKNKHKRTRDGIKSKTPKKKQKQRRHLFIEVAKPNSLSFAHSSSVEHQVKSP